MTNISISENEKRLREAPLGGLFMRYAIPGVVGLMFYGVQTIIDAIIVGNYLGPDALAGVNLILPCYSLAGVLAIMIGIGSQTLVSIGLGEKNYEKARDAMTTGFLAILVFCSVMALLVFTFASDMAELLGADARLMPYSVAYIRGVMPFIPAITLMLYSDYMLKGLGHTRYAMIIMTSTVIINIALSLLFITQLGMGTMGVGLATGISFTLGAICSLCVTMRRRNHLHMTAGRFRFPMLWRMIYNGSSEGVAELSVATSITAFNLTLMKYIGPDGVAAFTAINYTFFMGVTAQLGMSDGVIPIISYNYGAGNAARVIRILKIAAISVATVGVVLFLALSIFGRSIISLFFDGNASGAMSIAANGASIYCFAFLLCGLNILSSSFFTALANAKVSAVISLLRGVVFVLPGLLFLPMVMGVDGIWLSVPLSETLTFIIAIILVSKMIKKLKHNAA